MVCVQTLMRESSLCSSLSVCVCVCVCVLLSGEATLTDALSEAGKTYEEIALMVAEQVGHTAYSATYGGGRRMTPPEWFLLIVVRHRHTTSHCLSS